MQPENKPVALPGFLEYASIAILSLMILLLAANVIVQKLGSSIPPDIVQHLVLWLAFTGGIIASREKRHLSMASGIALFSGKAKTAIQAVVDAVSLAVSVTLTLASLSFVLNAFMPGQTVGFVPVQAVSAILPIGFSIISVRFLFAIEGTKKRIVLGAIGIIAGAVIGASPAVKSVQAIAVFLSGGDSALAAGLQAASDWVSGTLFSCARHSTVPLIALLALCAVAGMPIFVVLSGLALLLFYGSSGFVETVPNEIYVMLTGNLIPAIPLFTLAGFILTEGRAGRRFVNLFRALFGSLPGGHAITTIIICALFTTITGGSGVTILTLGALLLYILRKNGYGERFSNGLIVTSGSSGLHFPPSLPLILYGVVTEMDIKQLFIGGLLPGVFLIVALALFGVQHAVRMKVRTFPFSATRAVVFLRGAFWEILFPVMIVASYFSGFTSLVGTAALACVYAIVVCVFIRRDIPLRDMPSVIARSLPVIGGVLVLYACALAFKIFIVDAEVPSQLASWMIAHVESKYLFLLILNAALLVAGFFTETVSAIIVLAPIVVPLGNAYGIHPVHLAIIFIANLELGFLTPPFGMNLFLASYRFERPVSAMYRSVVPFFFVMLAGVLVITYVPWLSTGLLGLFKPGG